MFEHIEKFEYVFDHIHEAVCITDNDGVVVVWSTGSEKLYGVEKQEIIGKKLRNLFPQALLLKVLKTKKAVENVLHSPRKGSYVNMSAAPLFYKDRMIGAVATDRDLSEAVKLTTDLSVARQKLDFFEMKMNKINENRYVFDNIIGTSEAIKRCTDIAAQIAKNKISVLITGESGTGKEVFARAIHKASERKGDFVAINCSAVPETLFESEMFGYEEGSFTGASSKGRTGKIELAHNGTLFLDEIGDMPLYMQAKLLRVLQEKQISKVGGNKTKDIDIRIISATNQDLGYMVENKSFRKDLYYRLNAVMLKLPPLSRRKEDIPDFIMHFLTEFCIENNMNIPSIDRAAMDILCSYSWPGNIREIKNVTEHLAIFAKGSHIALDNLPSYITSDSPCEEDVFPQDSVSKDAVTDVLMDWEGDDPKEENNISEAMDLKEIVRHAEINAIKKAMKATGDNKYRAARLLNIPRSTLYYKLGYYGIESDNIHKPD